jgi:hypothetical protein
VPKQEKWMAQMRDAIEAPVLVRALRAFRSSGLAVDRDGQRRTDLAHPGVGESAESFDEHRERHTLDRIEVHRRTLWDGIVTGLENDLAGQRADRRGARSDERATQAWYRGVA